jgi:hypothetical protein
MLLFVLPALVVAQPPAPPQTLDHLQECLEAIPEALIDGNRGSMRGLVGKVKAEWDRAKPELRKAMPEAESIAIDRQLKAMRTMKPIEQAVGALGISSTLSRFQAKSHQQDLLNADRTAMLAWCLVDAGQLERLPGVAEGFKPLLDQDKGKHARAAMAVPEALKLLEESQQKRHAAGAKKALKQLLDLVDAFEKP